MLRTFLVWEQKCILHHEVCFGEEGVENTFKNIAFTHHLCLAIFIMIVSFVSPGLCKANKRLLSTVYVLINIHISPHCIICISWLQVYSLLYIITPLFIVLKIVQISGDQLKHNGYNLEPLKNVQFQGDKQHSDYV